MHNKFKAILAIFFLLSLKQEQNTSYISYKKHYTLFIYEQNAFFVQMYIRWRNTVTYFDKNLQFFCDNFHNIFFPIFIHTNLDMDHCLNVRRS